MPEANELSFAVAFLSRGGLRLIQPHLDKCLAKGGKAEFLVGLDFENTDPEALRLLMEMKREGLPVSCYCFLGQKTLAGIYHPKLYVVASEAEVTAVVGSSNLTQGGLKGNIEVNAVIEASPSDELISDIYGIYSRLKFQQNRFQPDAEMVALYSELHKENAKRARENAVSLKPSMQRFRDKVRSLPRPIATEANLFGWQRLVYERLPAGVFRTSDMYAFENDFQQYYPQNQNVRAKIRQILQQLRELRLIEHSATNRWERKQ